MPIELGIWKLGSKLDAVKFSSMDAEEKLENYLEKDLSLVAPRLMLIGRQVATAFAKFVDLLAMDGDDNLAVNGVQVKPGVLYLPTTDSLAWTDKRHRRVGNIGMADGSIQQVTSNGLNAAVINATNGTPFTTYRLVIP